MKHHSLEAIGLKLLKPENTKIFKGTYNMLHILVKDDSLYRGVFAARTFPLSNPNRYISLFYFNEYDKKEEIGIIENLSEFSEEAQKLILETLNKNYFSHEILEINSIKRLFGLLYFEVETDKGPRSFYLRPERRRATEFGIDGKILHDVFDDRYIIQSVEALPRREREIFKRYVYW